MSLLYKMEFSFYFFTTAFVFKRFISIKYFRFFKKVMDKEEIAKKNMVDKIKEEVKIMSRISTKYVVKLFYALHREKKVYLVSFFYF